MAIAVASVTPTVLATRQTTHPVNMPAAVSAGDWLVALITLENNPGITTPGDWSLLASDVTAGSAAGNRLAAYAKIASGSEGGTTVDFVADATSRGAAHVYRISGAYNDIATGCVAATPVTGIVSTSANPPSVTASWMGETNLFLAFASASDDNENFTSAPTNYTGLVSTGSGVADNNDSTLGSAYRILAADSDDPDSFGLDSTGNCIACTIVIRPAAAGGGPTAYEDSISLGLSSGITAASTAAANDAVALGVSSGLGLLSVVSAGDAVSLGLSAGLTCGATAAAQDALSIGVSSGLGTAGAAAAIDTLSLGLAAGINNSGVAAALGAISVGIGLGLSISDAAAQQYSDTLGIGVGIGITAASTAAASDGFTLTLEAGLSAAGLAAAQATITIGITSDVLAAAQASTFDAIQIGAALGTAIASSLGGAVPPASRTITVSAQGRAIQVQLQTRRIVV